MDTTHGLAAILRDARKGALLRMRSEINSQPLEPVNDADLILRSLRSKRLEGWIQRTRGHPSRRAQGRAPQDEVGDIFTTSQDEVLQTLVVRSAATPRVSNHEARWMRPWRGPTVFSRFVLPLLIFWKSGCCVFSLCLKRAPDRTDARILHRTECWGRAFEKRKVFARQSAVRSIR
jgi:hypothetical protein